MADDLVVREWFPKDVKHRGWVLAETRPPHPKDGRALLSKDRCIDEHNALKRAYLERDAQLAAMTAHRDEFRRVKDEDERVFRDVRAQLAIVTAEMRQKDEMMAALNSEAHIAKERLAAMTAERDEAMETAELVRAARDNWRNRLTASEAARGRLETRIRSAVAWINNHHGSAQDEWVDTAVRLLEPALAKPGKAGEP